MIIRIAATLAVVIACLVGTTGIASAQQIYIDVNGNGNYQPCGSCQMMNTDRGQMIMVRTQYGLTPCDGRCMIVNPNQGGYGYNGGYGHGYYASPNPFYGNSNGNMGQEFGNVIGNVTGDSRAAAIGMGLDLLLGLAGRR